MQTIAQQILQQAPLARYWAYLNYVERHRKAVQAAGRGLRVPAHTLFFHDWDKYLPFEFISYAQNFYNPDGSKKTTNYKESIAFVQAWMNHQHRNKHHWQYWLKANGKPLYKTKIVVMDDGGAYQIKDGQLVTWSGKLTAEPMEEPFLSEMIADWRGAGQAILGDKYTENSTKDWYLANKDKMILSNRTRAWVELYLGLLQR